MKRLNVAVVGVGHLGRIHARKLTQLPGARLVGVVDPNEAARQAVAEDCGTAAFAEPLEIVGKADAAVIAAPTWLHHRIGMQLIQAGLHVFIEKPLAVSVEEADELVAAATKAGVVLQTGHIERFNPALQPVLTFARKPKYIEAHRYTGFLGRALDVGVVLDLMIHDIDIVASLVRSPLREVEALGISVLSDHEDAAQARLVFEDGCVANLSASRISPDVRRTMQVWSQEGFVALDFASRTSQVTRPTEAVVERQVQLEVETPAQRESLKQEWLTRYFEQEQFAPQGGDQIVDELTDFVAAIQQGRQPRVTGEDGREALQIAARVLESIAGHSWDGVHGRRRGPSVAPLPAVLPGPHWLRRAPSKQDSVLHIHRDDEE